MEGLPVHVVGSAVGALVGIFAIPDRIQYEAEASGRELAVTVLRGSRAPDGGIPPVHPGMERAGALVAAFLQARVDRGTWPEEYLSDLARLQYQHLYGASPAVVRSYRDWRQGSQWPGDADFHLVRVEGDGWFADEMIYVTAKDGKPQIAMVLGHPPVAVPADPDGQLR